MATKKDYYVSNLPDAPVIDEDGNFRPSGIWGATYFVDYRNGADTNNGLSKGNALKTLSASYGKVTSNNQDFVVCDGDSEVAEDGMITWAKNRSTVYGVGGGFMRAQGTRLTQSATGVAAAIAANLTITGTRTKFANMKISNTGTDAASLAAVIDEGEGTTLVNVSTQKFSDLNVATVADFICRADSPSYLSCEFGFDTLVQSAARPTFWIKHDGSTRAKSINMWDCHFVCASSEATKSFILVDHTSSLAFANDFHNCTFNNALVGSASAAALNDAVTSVSGLLEGNLNFYFPASNTSEFCSAVTDQVWTYGTVTSAQAGEGGTPS